MEAIVLFLAKAAASGTIGHYLKKGLEKIDSHLRQMIDAKESTEKIADYIKTKDISSEVSNLASEIVKKSIFIPFDPSQVQPVDIRVEFFKQVLEAGYLLSDLWKADLVLPGSILGPLSLTVFLRSEASQETLSRIGVRMSIPQGRNASTLAIIPVKNSKELSGLWEDYKIAFLNGKSTTNEYLSIETLLPCVTSSSVLKNKSVIFSVETVTAAGIKYKSHLLAKEAVGESLTDNEITPLGAWVEGVNAMLQGAADLLRVQGLSDDEFSSMKKLSEQLKNLIDQVA